MIHSMTGYGRADYADEKVTASVEMRSVNNRYLDLNIRMPRRFNPFDAKIRALLKQKIGRGKVDIFINYAEEQTDEGALHFDRALAEAYLTHLLEIAKMDGVDPKISPVDIARMPDVLRLAESEEDEDRLWEILEKLLTDACDAFLAARAAEGEALKADILVKLDQLEADVREVVAHEPAIAEAYRQRLYEKLAELLADSDIEESRLVQETVLYADRISTDEEQVRLLTHIDKMRATLGEEGSIGRNLDFLTQEMNREANTMLSKAGDLVTADTALGIKTVIEKIREQIQNIE